MLSRMYEEVGTWHGWRKEGLFVHLSQDIMSVDVELLKKVKAV